MPRKRRDYLLDVETIVNEATAAAGGIAHRRDLELVVLEAHMAHPEWIDRRRIAKADLEEVLKRRQHNPSQPSLPGLAYDPNAIEVDGNGFVYRMASIPQIGAMRIRSKYRKNHDEQEAAFQLRELFWTGVIDEWGDAKTLDEVMQRRLRPAA